MAPRTQSKAGVKGNKTAPNVRTIVKSILDSRVEHKRVSSVFAVASATAGAVTPLTQGIIQGDDINQRSGDQIIFNKISFVISAVNTLATGNPSNLRIILFHDRLNVGTIPLVTELLTAATPSDAYNLLSLQANRFKIIKDWYMVTVSGQMNSVVSQEHTFKVHEKVQYNGSTNVSGANGRNALYMLFIDSTAAGATYRVGLNLTYTDL